MHIRHINTCKPRLDRKRISSRIAKSIAGHIHTPSLPKIRQLNERDVTASKSCIKCFKATDNLKRCASCKVVSYCSVKCQRADWPAHKPYCAAPINWDAEIVISSYSYNTDIVCSHYKFLWLLKCFFCSQFSRVKDVVPSYNCSSVVYVSFVMYRFQLGFLKALHGWNWRQLYSALLIYLSDGSYRKEALGIFFTHLLPCYNLFIVIYTTAI